MTGPFQVRRPRLHSMRGNSSHAAAVTVASPRQAQHCRYGVRVIVKRLIKIAHARERQIQNTTPDAANSAVARVISIMRAI